jgi:hypothetical protein
LVIENPDEKGLREKGKGIHKKKDNYDESWTNLFELKRFVGLKCFI